MATHIERIIGKTGIIILSKLTGLILSALAAQIVFTGIRNFLL
jgi:multiple antibiotic resistance protein